MLYACLPVLFCTAGSFLLVAFAQLIASGENLAHIDNEQANDSGEGNRNGDKQDPQNIFMLQCPLLRKAMLSELAFSIIKINNTALPK
ncbi:hypothetical protein T07_7511 [Trichinella nelsoni]|uniref:Secreted protein n=1 Tax=Trichinella nelsoni TaxID=6336 RepID=A0A0V0SHL0_9BILA|nr:hypothetical protein T07_7511 [Trichinella nelsoni]